MFPSLPTWSELHPIVIHFPIALLFVAPLFIVLSLIFQKSAKAFTVSALVLMVIGTIAAVVAVQTGEAASEPVEHLAQAEAILERHEDLAELAQWLFLGLTATFAGLSFLPVLLKKTVPPALWVTAHVVFLMAYAGCAGVLGLAAHQGGRLVHEAGIHTAMGWPEATVSTAPSPQPDRSRGRDRDHDDD